MFSVAGHLRKYCSDNRSLRHVCYGFQRSKAPTHIRFRRNGRYRASLPQRGLSLADLANAAPPHDQSAHPHPLHRPTDPLFPPRPFTPPPPPPPPPHPPLL